MRNLLISMVANFLFWWTKQIFFLVEPLLLSWLQPRKCNCVPTELDVSISANDPLRHIRSFWTDFLHGILRRPQDTGVPWVQYEAKTIKDLKSVIKFPNI